jgi:dephospho-CoA kinase
MLLFGLTGGIASGKSAVSARLRARGVPVIDADVLAREVVLPGTDGHREVVEAFGAGVLAEDGTIDRKALGALVFADDAKRLRLMAITHPRIGALTARRAQELAAKGERMACYDAALLVENGVEDAFRPLVVVAAPEELQVARIVARDGVSEEEARARVLAQMPLEKKIAVADYVIHNAGTLEELAKKTDEVLEKIVVECGSGVR